MALLDNNDERALESDTICVVAKFPVAEIIALLNSVDSNDSNVLLDDIEGAPELVLTDADPRTKRVKFWFSPRCSCPFHNCNTTSFHWE
jgi:hypothetical protein